MAANPVLRGLKGALADRLAVAARDVAAAIAQLHILRAADEFLDQWGVVFGWPRLIGETDQAYGPRIIVSTIRQRPQPRALEDIVWREVGVRIRVRNLWPMVLHSDIWTVPASRPPNVSDGHLLDDWIPGGPDDIATRSAFGAPYLPTAFGVWVDVAEETAFIYTLENVITHRPLVLLSDQEPPTEHVSDGHLDDGIQVRHSFAVATPSGIPGSVVNVLRVIDRHRAAGTEAVFMGLLTV